MRGGKGDHVNVKMPNGQLRTLPGCFSQGESLEKTLEGAKEAIEAHLAALRNEGTKIPVDRDVLISRVTVFSSL